jgi:ubiquinone/menaquinone biosynthesis C-methylase UbiE
MSLHPLAERFAAVADHYERGRPEYPPAVAGALMAELGLGAGARALDLGAGTGKLTRALLAAGLDVVAVEPLEALRELLASVVGPERVLEGVAEAIPLADDSVAAVTIADAIHWFDQDAALGEIERVLRPRGGLAVVASVPDWSGASWADELGKLIAGLRPEHPLFDNQPWQEVMRARGRWAEPREIRVTSSIGVDPERIVDNVASLSWIAALSDEQRGATIARIRALVQSGHTPDALPVHVVLGLTELL